MIDPALVPHLTRYGLQPGQLLPGCYYQTCHATAVTTNAALGVGILRVTPFIVPRHTTLTQIGGEVTAVGDAGCTLRLGVYADDGKGFPGNLVLDAGTIPGDAVAVAQVAISKLLPPGVYWVGEVVQGVTTTQPTVRSLTQALYAAGVPLTNGSTPIANAPINIGYAKTGVTGALPATWGATVSPTTVAGRVFVKIA